MLLKQNVKPSPIFESGVTNTLAYSFEVTKNTKFIFKNSFKIIYCIDVIDAKC